ncbi:hypothetical protein [Defluviicoccus vanus]|uniref:DUF4102 domain-containing protein n=1 Tax=Defluviicoccus vanus TaxID=111831 RepID=A0A7H1N5J4_9PROT|nr:hypothetical protein [Defluviicoccus vanus]QNT70980.1 hypothetical protein HQ394_18785 [Defluviicoccus vanus]
MATSITISTQRYERIFGRKPQGFGLWYFQFPGGRVFTHLGFYAAASQAATDHAHAIRCCMPLLIQVSA